MQYRVFVIVIEISLKMFFEIFECKTVVMICTNDELQLFVIMKIDDFHD